MKEHEKEADRIVDMFGDKALLHVEGIIIALENHSWQNRHYIEDYQKVKEAIQNK